MLRLMGMMPRMMARPWSDTCTWPHRRAATPANDHESRVLHWSQRNGLADDGFGNYFSHTQGQAPAWSVRHETIVMAMAVSMTLVMVTVDQGCGYVCEAKHAESRERE